MSRIRLALPFAAFGISILAVQGSIYALQIVSAGTVDISEYGTIRTIESVAAVLALAITFGLPSTLLVHARRSMEVKLLGRTGAASFLSLLAAMIAATLLLVALGWWLFPTGDFDWTLAAALPLSFLMAVRLIFTAAGQAQQRFSELAKAAAAASIIGVGSFGIAIAMGQANMWSWIVARVLLESIVIAGIWKVSFGSERFRFRPWKTTIGQALQLSQSALPLGASLFLRSLLDQGPILLATAITAGSTIVAEVGLIVTICTIALVPALTAQGVVVPRLVEAAFAGAMPYKAVIVYVIAGALASALIVCVLLMAVPLLVSWAEMSDTNRMASVAVIVAAKMAAGACGGVLLALQYNRVILALNVSTACLGTSAAWMIFIMRESLSTDTFLNAIALVEVAGAAFYIASILIIWRKR